VTDLQYDIAGPGDDAELRRLLREVPMEGALTLTLEREPDFFRGAEVEGTLHQTAICRDLNAGRVVAMVGRSVRSAWLNGQVGPLGYIGHGRIEPRFRNGFTMVSAFDALADLHRDQETRCYVAVVFEDNAAGQRVARTRWHNMPRFRQRGVLCSLALPLWRRKRVRTSPAFDVRTATPDDLPDIAECLQRNYRKLQFAPCWSADDLADPRRTRGLSPTDFRIAVSNRRVVGCLAGWDQQSFKQMVVHSYPEHLALFRRLINLTAPFGRWPQLPAPGHPLPYIFVSHVAIDDDDREVFVALLNSLRNELVNQCWTHLAIGMAERAARGDLSRSLGGRGDVRRQPRREATASRDRRALRRDG
jgi:hypothetical protein